MAVTLSIYNGMEVREALHTTRSPTSKPLSFGYSAPISVMKPQNKPPVSVTGLCSLPRLITISIIFCLIRSSLSLASRHICLKLVPSICILLTAIFNSKGIIFLPLSSFQADTGRTYWGSRTLLIPKSRFWFIFSSLLFHRTQIGSSVVTQIITQFVIFCKYYLLMDKS